jgi:hypothetical protein
VAEKEERDMKIKATEIKREKITIRRTGTEEKEIIGL